VKEILAVGKLCYEVRERNYDLVVVDAEASGHIVAQIDAPRAIRDLVQVGMVRDQTDWMLEILGDRARTGLVVVTTPEEMPVTETVELAKVQATTDVDVAAVIANRVLPQWFSAADAEVFDALNRPEAQAALVAAAGSKVATVFHAATLARARRQMVSEHLQRLRDEVDAAVPLVLVFVLCAFFYVLVEQSIMSWLPTFNSKVLQLPTALSIEMASILAGATALGRFLAGIVMKKLNWYVVLTACLVLAAILVFTAIPLAKGAEGRTVTGWSDAPLAAFVFPLIGLFLAPVYPAINSLILSSLPKNQHGLMSGLIIIFSALGGTTGSIITGNIFGKFGGQTAFYFSLVPIGILLTGLYFFKKLQLQSIARSNQHSLQ